MDMDRMVMDRMDTDEDTSELSSFSLTDTIAVLERTPAALDALVRGLPSTFTERNEGGDTWTVFDIVGHLAYSERVNFLPRAKFLLRHGQSQVFEPFDRTGQVKESAGKTLPQLLDEFSRLRAGSLHELRAMTLGADELAMKGKHPAFGTVTLSQLLTTWPAHDLTHLHQIVRVMAYQQREAVGPWARYLGVMQCAGHGG